jgi:hypothetical protein
MHAGLRWLRAAAVAAPLCARAGLPCDGWVSTGSSLELHGPAGSVVVRAAPEALAALRRTLLAGCVEPGAGRPPLDIGPVEVDADLRARPETGPGILELRVRMRAERFQLTMP